MAAIRWWGLSTPLALGLFAAWFVKDLALFPVLRRAYETGEASPAEALVGSRCIVLRTLDEEGTVRLGAELWRARVGSDDAPVHAGATVRVRAVRGLTLIVEPESAGPDVPEAPRAEKDAG